MTAPTGVERRRPPRRRQWGRDLAMGVRFALTGGREDWVRVALTATIARVIGGGR